MYDVPKTPLAMTMFAVCFLMQASRAGAAGDAVNGAEIFRQCGALADFPYSPAMQDAAKKGLTWTAENAASYLENPRKFLNDFAGSSAPNKMPFSLADAKEREDVVAYLQASR